MYGINLKLKIRDRLFPLSILKRQIQVFFLVWTYGIELWRCSKSSNTKILQTFQSKTLRKLANVPWYISNVTLHNDLSIPYVTEVIRTYVKNHKNRTAQNKKQLIRDLFNQPEIGRRLNRMWTEDLIR
jgi:hypothetical protein